MKPPKKSEMLEVRLSHPDKLALQDKAAQEGRTVSDVVRGLISSYISPDDTRSTYLRLPELFMTLKSKPKSIGIAALACLAAPFTFSNFAFADEISLTLNGEFSEPVTENDEDGLRVRRFATEVHMDSNQTMRVNLTSNREDPLVVVVTTQDSKDGVSLKLEIINNCEVIAMPQLIANYDETARVEIGHENGKLFMMEAVPAKR
jgi:hypothetical protein